MNKKIEQEIIKILHQNPEEFLHAKNTLSWLLKLDTNLDFIIKISTLGHDIERVLYDKDDKEYSSHKEFKLAHSKRSAKILKNILLEHKIEEKQIQRMQNIVLNHEFGGNKEANLVKDADSLANLQWCDDMFGKLEKSQLRDTMKRMYNRMELNNKKFVRQIKFKHIEVEKLLKEICSN